MALSVNLIMQLACLVSLYHFINKNDYFKIALDITLQLIYKMRTVYCMLHK